MQKKLIIVTLLGITGLAIYKVHRVIERRRFLRERARQLEYGGPVSHHPYEYTL